MKDDTSHRTLNHDHIASTFGKNHYHSRLTLKWSCLRGRLMWRSPPTVSFLYPIPPPSPRPRRQDGGVLGVETSRPPRVRRWSKRGGELRIPKNDQITPWTPPLLRTRLLLIQGHLGRDDIDDLLNTSESVRWRVETRSEGSRCLSSFSRDERYGSSPRPLFVS